MAWLLAGPEQRDAVAAVETIARIEWGWRADAHSMAEDIVAGLYQRGFRVITEEPPLPDSQVRSAMERMLAEALEEHLTWDTFRTATDADLAKLLAAALLDDADHSITVRDRP